MKSKKQNNKQFKSLSDSLSAVVKENLKKTTLDPCTEANVDAIAQAERVVQVMQELKDFIDHANDTIEESTVATAQVKSLHALSLQAVKQMEANYKASDLAKTTIRQMLFIGNKKMTEDAKEVKASFINDIDRLVDQIRGELIGSSQMNKQAIEATNQRVNLVLDQLQNQKRFFIITVFFCVAFGTVIGSFL